MSRGARVYGWVFHPRMMLEFRRMQKETSRKRALAAELRAKAAALDEEQA